MSVSTFLVSRAKSPSRPVEAPFIVPFSRIVAPITGPTWSTTTPFTSYPPCADTAGVKMQNISNPIQIDKILFIGFLNINYMVFRDFSFTNATDTAASSMNTPARSSIIDASEPKQRVTIRPPVSPMKICGMVMVKLKMPI